MVDRRHRLWRGGSSERRHSRQRVQATHRRKAVVRRRHASLRRTIADSRHPRGGVHRLRVSNARIRRALWCRRARWGHGRGGCRGSTMRITHDVLRHWRLRAIPAGRPVRSIRPGRPTTHQRRTATRLAAVPVSVLGRVRPRAACTPDRRHLPPAHGLRGGGWRAGRVRGVGLTWPIRHVIMTAPCVMDRRTSVDHRIGVSVRRQLAASGVLAPSKGGRSRPLARSLVRLTRQALVPTAGRAHAPRISSCRNSMRVLVRVTAHAPLPLGRVLTRSTRPTPACTHRRAGHHAASLRGAGGSMRRLTMSRTST